MLGEVVTLRIEVSFVNKDTPRPETGGQNSFKAGLGQLPA
jgi:hypothetical protein